MSNPKTLREQMAERMRTAAQRVGLFRLSEEEAARVRLFAYIYSVYGYEVAQLDNFVLKELKAGAGKHVQDEWLGLVLDTYKTNKGLTNTILIQPCPEREIDREFNLEIVPDAARLEYWTEINTALTNSGFYTLIEQLAYWDRAKGKSEALSQISNVNSTLSDARYDPGQMKRLHEQVLMALARMMEDRTRVLTADRIAKEHNFIVLNAIQDPDVLHFICKPPRGTDDIVGYFWSTDQIDLSLERAGLMIGEAITAAIVALVLYDPQQGYASQMDTFAAPANHAFTLLEEMSALSTQRYGNLPGSGSGMTKVAATLIAAVSVRVRVGNVEVEVQAQAAAATTTTHNVVQGNATTIGGNVTGPVYSGTFTERVDVNTPPPQPGIHVAGIYGSTGVAIGTNASANVGNVESLTVVEEIQLRAMLLEHRRTPNNATSAVMISVIEARLRAAGKSV